jgi:hypothetical protein
MSKPYKSITYVTVESKSLCPVEMVEADLLFSVFCFAIVLGVMVLLSTWVSSWVGSIAGKEGGAE